MTLFTITAPSSGPVAVRQGDLVIPGTEVAFGGFSSVIGQKATDSASNRDAGDLDVYLLGMASAGLQLARVGVSALNTWDQYSFWDPQTLEFTAKPPDVANTDPIQAYLSGTYSSGSVFFSPYFQTFLMVYFNKMVDSTFYVRYLDLSILLKNDTKGVWMVNGKFGNGIVSEDVEALIRYSWSPEQKLYSSPPGMCPPYPEIV